MAERGVELYEDFPPGVTLNIPPFLDGKPHCRRGAVVKGVEHISTNLKVNI